MPVRADVHSRRILRDVVCVIARKEVSTLTPQLDFSPRTRVYVRGGRWVGHLFKFRPVQSDTNRQIPIKKIFGSFPADVVDILLGIPV